MAASGEFKPSERVFALPKAPEGWRSPRRFARFGCHRSTRQRLGLRRHLRVPTGLRFCKRRELQNVTNQPRQKTAFSPRQNWQFIGFSTNLAKVALPFPPLAQAEEHIPGG